MYFVINMLNKKTIILVNLVEYRLILADAAYAHDGRKYRDIVRRRAKKHSVYGQ